jgi:hypothetical protein
MEIPPRVQSMYAMHRDGANLREVSLEFGICRATVIRALKTYGLPIHGGKRGLTRLPGIYWNGLKFTIDPDGYYRQTTNPRRHLHQLVWEFHHGPIPEGHIIHHRDENKANNEPSNLECIPNPDHGFRHRQSYEPIYCEQCGGEIERRCPPSGIESIRNYQRRRFCGLPCYFVAVRDRRGIVAK